MTRNVPFLDLAPSLALIREELDRAWERVLDHGVFVGGPEVEEFEEAFARFCGAPHCVGVGNGTDALELVLKALGVERGSKVIVPTNTFIASAAAISNVGAIPQFVDVDDDTLLVTPDIVSDAITSETSAILCVHLYGQPCDLDGLAAVASKAGIPLVEDAAQAHGATFRGRPIGAQSAAATFSFYPGKNLGAIGDGGAVVTHDDLLAARVTELSRHGRSVSDRYAHNSVGRNSRLDSLNAAFLTCRLAYLDAENARRREARSWYEELLPPWVRLVGQAPDRTSANHLIVARTSGREAFRDALAQRGVSTGVHYPIPCHRQAAFRDLPHQELPVAEAAADEIVSLPAWGHIERSDVEYVCDQIYAIAAMMEHREDTLASGGGS